MSTEDDFLNTWAAIREGDLPRLADLLRRDPTLVNSTLGAFQRSPLHVATDWPGYFPNGPQIVAWLISAGADVNDRGPEGTGESPLHWAASTDDATVAAVLIAHGADIEAPDGSIGTPLDNAIGYGCWNVARLLVGSGARVDKLWHAAALGLLERLGELAAAQPPPAGEELGQALWHACDGGQRRAADLLIDLGADLGFTPDYGHGTILDVAARHGTQRSNLIERLESLGVQRAQPATDQVEPDRSC